MPYISLTYLAKRHNMLIMIIGELLVHNEGDNTLK